MVYHRLKKLTLRVDGFQQPFPFLLRPLSLSCVTRNLGKTTDASMLVVESGSHNICPKPRAVLAYAPAFVFEPAILEGYPKFLIGFFAAVFFREKT